MANVHKSIILCTFTLVDNHPPLPSNLTLAISHLQQVKNRLLKLDLWQPYADIIAN